ncbi:hypothetical protein CFO_g2376 [Ceratocystis platani]|uniref:Uncharacterized protein n=1 Tax=Ceratocystis fimbriata f. sp. platani TaxID=88771 RepID=A0A0F8DH49_CERFI|nr:hypothetical protein CFO_g2376 [Ceratocystis platani]
MRASKAAREAEYQDTARPGSRSANDPTAVRWLCKIDVLKSVSEDWALGPSSFLFWEDWGEQQRPIAWQAPQWWQLFFSSSSSSSSESPSNMHQVAQATLRMAMVDEQIYDYLSMSDDDDEYEGITAPMTVTSK